MEWKYKLILLIFFGQSSVLYGQITKWITVEQTADYKIEVAQAGNCKVKSTYLIKIDGIIRGNYLFSWKISYVPCIQSQPVTKTISQAVSKKGPREFKQDLNGEIQQFVIGAVTKEEIADPTFEFTQSCPVNIDEGDEAYLSIRSSVQGVKWNWKRDGRAIGKDGASIREKIVRTSKYSVYPRYRGFDFEEKSCMVNVIPTRLPGSSDFVITGKNKITDCEFTTLEVNSNNFNDLQWVWVTDGGEVARGTRLKVSPQKSTTYDVYAINKGKASVRKSFNVEVNKIAPPPVSFHIVGPDTILEGEKVQLKLKNPDSYSEIKWIWTIENDPILQYGTSIIVSPSRKTNYTLVGEKGCKTSAKVSKTIEVIQKAVAPIIVGNLTRCASSTVPNEIALQGGKLGTGSTRWTWYEGKCGSGILISSGDVLKLSPEKTTSYYVQPDKNSEACTAFTIVVGSLPVIPSRIIAPDIVCHNQPFALEVISKNGADTKLEWYSQLNSWDTKKLVGYGTRIQSFISASTIYTLQLKNDFCEIEAEKVIVNVRQQINAPIGILQTNIKGRSYKMTVVGTTPKDGNKWAWYRGESGGSLLGYGNEILVQAKSKNSISVRAEGICDSSSFKTNNFTYDNFRSKYFFLNLGISSNDIENDFPKMNGRIAFGSRKMYLAGKFPLDLFINSGQGSYSLGVDLETNDAKVLNYPSNTNTYYVYNGEIKNTTYGATGGFLIGGNNFRIYLGGGYGIREQQWGVDIISYSSTYKLGSAYAKHLDKTLSGPIAEAGIFLKLGAFNIMGGMNALFGTASEIYQEANVGIGFNINKRNQKR